MEILSLKERSFGLDISDLSLKFIEFQKKKDKIFVSTFGESAIVPGVISEGKILDIEKLTNILKEALKRAEKKVSTKYVVCSLPEEKAFLQVIQIPKVNDSEIEKTILLEVENYIPLPISDVYFNYEVIEKGDDVNHIDVFISAVPKEIADSYASVIELAGFIPSALVLETQAIVDAVVKNNYSEDPIVIIDIGTTRTSFIIFYKNAIRFSSSISISADDFTKAISKGLKISLQEAEKIKKEKGFDENFMGGALLKCCSPLLERFSKETEKLISYYLSRSFHSHEGENAIKKIILCGGGALLKGFPQFIYKSTGISTETANPWINVFGENTDYIPPIPFQQSLSYTTAIGLALTGVKKSVFELIK